MNGSSPSNPELRETAAAYRTNGNAGDLEFPVAREFVSTPPRLTPDQYVVWCEERLREPLAQLVSAPAEPFQMRKEFVL
jgi:hypothetical protein